MSGKRIGLADGFEDLLGTLRATQGDYPNGAEMASVSGASAGLGRHYFSALEKGGTQIYLEIKKLDDELQRIQEAMKLAIEEQRAVDAEAADTLNALLAEVEGLNHDVAGSDPAAQAPKTLQPPSGRAKDPSGSNSGTEWML
ncbi:hypothetical protein [Leucobacter sp. L43]|uniref:hypothetical protein n=1 Tax=Leucobacter sp. L43 TaxID=2798040 RepID=UPI000ABA8390|nr:hypothetical protein [Leucobacter sp. L43]